MVSQEDTECKFEVARPRTGVQLNDILITAELAKRAYREPNWKAESIAFSTLARLMANKPERLVGALLRLEPA